MSSSQRNRIKKNFKLKNVSFIPQLAYTQSGIFNLSPMAHKTSSTHRLFMNPTCSSNNNNNNQLFLNNNNNSHLMLGELNLPKTNRLSNNCIYIYYLINNCNSIYIS